MTVTYTKVISDILKVVRTNNPGLVIGQINASSEDSKKAIFFSESVTNIQRWISVKNTVRESTHIITFHFYGDTRDEVNNLVNQVNVELAKLNLPLVDQQISNNVESNRVGFAVGSIIINYNYLRNKPN